MNNKLLSISIAAYNVSAYIEQCLDSLVACKNLDKLDIIVVDDGSKDNTVELVQAYVDKYPESIRLEAKENGGHGSTINRGMSVAVGKYFKVLDGDDWVDADELDQLLERLSTCDSDLVLTNYVKQFPDHSEVVDLLHVFEPNQEITMEEYNRRTDFYWIAMHTITVKTELYRQHDFKISEKQFYVDVEFIYFTLCSIETILYVPLNVYQYRLGRDGQSVSPEGLYKNIGDNAKMVHRLTTMYFSRTYSVIGRENVMYALIKSIYKGVFVWFSLLKDGKKDHILKEMDQALLGRFPEVSHIPLDKYKAVRCNYHGALTGFRLLRKLTGKGM